MDGRLKKGLSRLLIFMVIAAVFALGGAALVAAEESPGEGPVVYFEDITLPQGASRLVVPVMLRDNHIDPMLGLYMEIQFDGDQMEYERLVASPNTVSFNFLSNVEDENGSLLKIAGYSASELSSDGEIFLLEFALTPVPEEVPPVDDIGVMGEAGEDIVIDLAITSCEINDEEALVENGTIVISSAAGVDKGTLGEMIAQARDLLEEDYTQESWEELQEALEYAETIYESGEATQAQVDEALGLVLEAMDDLEFLDRRSTVYFEDLILAPEAGQLVVPVRVRDNRRNPLKGLHMEISYDDQRLSYVDLEESALTGLFGFKVNPEEGLLKVVMYSAYELQADGELFSLQFDVLPAEEEEQTTIGFAITSCEINDSETVIENGEILLAYIYDLTVEMVGEGTTEPVEGTHTYIEGTGVELSAFPESNWQFEKWVIGEEEHDTSIVSVTMDGDITATAYFKLNQYTVVFVDYDETEIHSELVEHGSSAEAPESPFRTGYTFTGWDKEYDNITEDLVVTAQYEINQYTVTFNSMGGSAVDEEVLDFNSLVTEPEDPIKEGYQFAGWFKEEGLENEWDFAEYRVSDDHMTLYAKWLVNQYSLTVAVEGEGTTDPEAGEHSFPENEQVILVATAAEGWIFDRWEVEGEAAGEGDEDPVFEVSSLEKVVSHEAEIQVTMDSDKVATAYFIEEDKEYDLIIKVAEGKGTTDPAPGAHLYPEGELVTLTVIPDIGYTFERWEVEKIDLKPGETIDIDSFYEEMIELTMDWTKEARVYFIEREEVEVYLESILVDGVMIEGFEKDRFVYGTLGVSSETGTVLLEAIPEDPGSIIRINGEERGEIELDLTGGASSVRIVVEQGNQHNIYSLTLRLIASAFLETITVDGTDILVDKAVQTYSYFVEDATQEKVTVSVVPEYKDAEITINNQPFTPGEPVPVALVNRQATVTIGVRTPDAQLNYRVNISQKRSSDASLDSLEINGERVADFDPETHDYTFVIEDIEAEGFEVKAVPRDANYSSVTVNGSPLAEVDNGDDGIDMLPVTLPLVNRGARVEVVVEAEDGTTLTYTVNVMQASDNTQLRRFFINGQRIPVEEGKTAYAVETSVGFRKEIDVVAVPDDPSNTVSISGARLDTLGPDGRADIEITVTAPDGSSTTYEVTVTLADYRVVRFEAIPDEDGNIFAGGLVGGAYREPSPVEIEFSQPVDPANLNSNEAILRGEFVVITREFRVDQMITNRLTATEVFATLGSDGKTVTIKPPERSGWMFDSGDDYPILHNVFVGDIPSAQGERLKEESLIDGDRNIYTGINLEFLPVYEEAGVTLEAPENFRGEALSPYAILWRWDDTNTEDFSYTFQLYRPVYEGGSPLNEITGYEFIASVPRYRTYYIETGLTPATSYNMLVVAITPFGMRSFDVEGTRDPDEIARFVRTMEEYTNPPTVFLRRSDITPDGTLRWQWFDTSEGGFEAGMTIAESVLNRRGRMVNEQVYLKHLTRDLVDGLQEDRVIRNQLGDVVGIGIGLLEYLEDYGLRYAESDMNHEDIFRSQSILTRAFSIIYPDLNVVSRRVNYNVKNPFYGMEELMAPQLIRMDAGTRTPQGHLVYRLRIVDQSIDEEYFNVYRLGLGGTLELLERVDTRNGPGVEGFVDFTMTITDDRYYNIVVKAAKEVDGVEIEGQYSNAVVLNMR